MRHPYLQGRVFRLGKIRYVVARQQTEIHRVKCYRQEGDNFMIVRLPLSLVLEQVVERIDLEEPSFC